MRGFLVALQTLLKRRNPTSSDLSMIFRGEITRWLFFGATMESWEAEP